MNSGRDGHWLFRLTPVEWIRAAETELAAARENIGRRRTALTHARRAAGMALNARLVAEASRPSVHVEEVWGRSYLEHLRLLRTPGSELLGLGPERREDASILVELPLVPKEQLVRLGRGPDPEVQRALDAAERLLNECRPNG